LKVQIKDAIRYGVPYVVSEQYACKKCCKRIMLRWDVKIYCLSCGQMPAHWNHLLKEQIGRIMASYPDPQQCEQEWRQSLPAKQAQDRSTEAVAFGGQVEEARIAKGWSHEQLASMIIKNGRGHLSPATLKMIEKGSNHCSQYVREQLIRVLGLREGAIV
jgi:ribosome-binding protein aMBF1 (putative translation factor)